jgi:hypothetical protein
MLFRLLAEQNNNSKRYLAICMTKMDTTRFRDSDNWRLLERVFGSDIYKLITNYRTTFNIEVFATSAAGYFVNERGEHVPNFSNGRLVDIDEWSPINCAAPFFWMFENQEIERIRAASNLLNRESNLLKYIKYPPPRRI